MLTLYEVWCTLYIKITYKLYSVNDLQSSDSEEVTAFIFRTNLLVIAYLLLNLEDGGNKKCTNFSTLLHLSQIQ
jgi:hypothetical protein